jgi:hypothetical protein
MVAIGKEGEAEITSLMGWVCAKPEVGRVTPKGK